MKKIEKILIYLLKKNYFFLCVYINMVSKYYQKKKEKLLKEAHERYQNVSEEEKKIKPEKCLRQISKSF